MKCILAAFGLLLLTNLQGQQPFNKIYDPNCKQTDTVNSVYSTFDKKRFNLPVGWQGEFLGENPALYAHKTIASIKFRIEAHRAYDSTGDIYKYYQINNKKGIFEIKEINGKKLLVE